MNLSSTRKYRFQEWQISSILYPNNVTRTVDTSRTHKIQTRWRENLNLNMRPTRIAEELIEYERQHNRIIHFLCHLTTIFSCTKCVWPLDRGWHETVKTMRTCCPTNYTADSIRLAIQLRIHLRVSVRNCRSCHTTRNYDSFVALCYK